ncbi:MAG TPA: HAMP domain-containing sensor histidine kinase, partial [Ignavibacteriaceae bacterium]|nr:HAMP domain-containing sensor histidine kinase [Ignavibacteriaceae bacterium]
TANHLFYLLTNLLEWSRLQTGNFVIEKTDFSLNLIINHILDIYSISISEKKLNIIKETECEINLFADIHMVESAVRNIISNAIKYSNIGGTVKIGCRIADDRAEIFIKDNGVGITIEDQARLFKIDKQFSTEGTNYEKGTGFGLLLTKELVEKNDGTVYLNSQIGKGTTVIIAFPLKSDFA